MATTRVNDETMITAIDSVVAAVLAEASRAFAELEGRTLDRRPPRELAPVDPRALAGNPFSMFCLESRETRWTQWLANSLRAQVAGEALARLTWEALAETLAEAFDGEPPLGDHLASAVDLSAVASELPTLVRAELHTARHGRPDLVLRAGAITLVLELKLYAGWHDGEEEKQADAYERAGRELLVTHGTERLGLVLLTPDGEMPHPDSWVRVTWQHFAARLRDGLERALVPDSKPAEVLALAPALYLVQAIEREFGESEIDLDVLRKCRPGVQLAEAKRHLENMKESRA